MPLTAAAQELIGYACTAQLTSAYRCVILVGQTTKVVLLLLHQKLNACLPRVRALRLMKASLHRQPQAGIQHIDHHVAPAVVALLNKCCWPFGSAETQCSSLWTLSSCGHND